ncbi:MAG: thioredoxin domain-containing protein [Pseudomonadota bacterium]|nr:thioredoxin domain-containing protein [Pseudomonadota bacterium]
MDLTSRLAPPVSARDHLRGAPNAPIELVEYGDYECPHSARARLVVQRLERILGSQLCYVFRNFPLTQAHPNALSAALFAEGAGLQGKFWQMHDRLYENQSALEEDDLVGYAAALGLDPMRLQRDFPAAHERVREDHRHGERSGVSVTPTFFVNGLRYDGPWWDVSDFAVVLEGMANEMVAPV